MQRRWFVVGFTAMFLIQSAAPARAWGRLGHRVISRIAKQNLTPHARDAIAKLLDAAETLADASTWADEHRRELPKTAPWHYVDVPLDEPRYDARYSFPDAKHGCIVDKITEFRATLNDPSKSKEDKRFALRFLVHLVGDMHQPCHVGDNHDRGGNDTQIRFFDRGSNMHRLWDSDLIEWNTRSEDVWLTELDSPEARAMTIKGTVEEWATESPLVARAADRVPGTELPIKPRQKLAKAYFDANLPVVRQRLYQGGIRLAMVLNEAVPAE